MPREIFSTNAPLSAADSAAQRAYTDEDYSGTFIRSAVAGRLRPRLRVVVGGVPVIEPLDAFEERLETRMHNGASRAPFLAVVENVRGESKAQSAIPKSQSAIRGEPRRPGLKKLNKKQTLHGWPPTPRGCEWRRSDNGLNLWRCWTEWDDNKTRKIKKSRYAGHLSDDAWRIMKEYDHEAFISIVGERLRRHSGR